MAQGDAVAVAVVVTGRRSALVLAAVTMALAACGRDTFTISGAYVYPVRGATSDEACRGPHSSEGRQLLIKELSRKTSQLVAETTLRAGYLETDPRRYGYNVVTCVYPFTVPGVPSGALGYGAAVEGESGFAFTEAEASGIVVEGGLPDLQ